MNTMIKDHRQEVFRTMTVTDSTSPQLLNRQKTTNSFKNLANVEHIEVESLNTQTANELYQFTSNNKTSSIKKQMSNIMDSYRENLSDFGEETKSKTISFMDKKSNSSTAPKSDLKQKCLTNNLNANSNSTHKLSKQKTEIISSQTNLLKNLQSDSLITTKLKTETIDKNKKKKDKKSKSKKDKDGKQKHHSSAVNIHAMENNLMNDMFRVNEQNTNKLNLKLNRLVTNSKLNRMDILKIFVKYLNS